MTTHGPVSKPHFLSKKKSAQKADQAQPDAAADDKNKTGHARFIDAVLALSHRSLFGPTSQPVAPRKQEVVSLAALVAKLSYLKPADRKLVKEAFQYADQAHLGQYRQSGEPYITHPVAVAEICADWKLDAQSIMAALLHDVIEDQGVARQELAEKFDSKVAELVDGLTKLDKLEFSSMEEAQAENFRKMLLAMARDVRVILVKLADRLHNMRTLGHMPLVKRKRVAAETMEIFAPIANRLGLNTTFRELQDLSFRYAYPFRYLTLEKSLNAARGNRREVISKILESVKKALSDAHIDVELSGREKSLHSIYTKMKDKRLSFVQVLDVYGFRVVVESWTQCYTAIGVLHALYKPMPGKFKDYIAIPKVNGYQSLHTKLVGPFGMPIEFQVRTRAMHEIAEAGVAAHWMYKDGVAMLSDVQSRAHHWLQSLLDIQSQSGNSEEFLEHVKIDLFPDAVYVFTPKSQIRALPRGATALDFAYAVHSDLGNQCIAIKINNELLPLRTELKNGDIVEVLTAPHSRPNPAWLRFLRSGRARSALRHALKSVHMEESVALGERLFDQALRSLGVTPEMLSSEIWDKLFHWSGVKGRDEIYTDIALGHRVAAIVAKRVSILLQESGTALDKGASGRDQAVLVNGSEGMSVTFATCCRPIPGDDITGYLGKGDGLEIHQHNCPVALRIHHRDPDRWTDVAWAEHPTRAFDVLIRLLARNKRGVLARVAAGITAADVNISHISTEEGGEQEEAHMQFVLQVYNRVHLAKIIRTLRHNRDVLKITRK
ncbi:MAG: bifunctional (p)ppGpp synthetase/guanosine-3',5'-bis(diphosphate) 3'-pyrophosphohydrolase [Ottowia sp.]|nr:bifunctional (p)ppGpp synthetase/guanosine-3',5'-bis(diphosphate) 3'-pyrophosphohydrolase [Ottowia sp.]